MTMTSFLDKLKSLGLEPIGSDSLLPFDESEIAELESLAGSEFPADYRRFLSEVGGCMLDADVAFPTIDPLPAEFSPSGLAVFDAFFTSARAEVEESSTLRWNIEQSPDSYSPNLIAIGDDGAGGMILLDLNPATKGAVLYYPQPNDWFTSDEEDPFRVAASFEDFIKALRLAPDE